MNTSPLFAFLVALALVAVGCTSTKVIPPEKFVEPPAHPLTVDQPQYGSGEAIGRWKLEHQVFLPRDGVDWVIVRHLPSGKSWIVSEAGHNVKMLPLAPQEPTPIDPTPLRQRDPRYNLLP